MDDIHILRKNKKPKNKLYHVTESVNINMVQVI